MTPTTHTPGPWELDATDFPLIVNGADEAVVASIPSHGEMAEANARLIAAAPALTDELRQTLDLLRSLIDQKVIYAAHLSDGGDALRLEAHERIAASRDLLARIDGA